MEPGIDGGDHSQNPGQNLSGGEMHPRGRDVKRRGEGERVREGKADGKSLRRQGRAKDLKPKTSVETA